MVNRRDDGDYFCLILPVYHYYRMGGPPQPEIEVVGLRVPLLREYWALLGHDGQISLGGVHMGVSQNWGYFLGVLHNKDCSILGSILGSPY